MRKCNNSGALLILTLIIGLSFSYGAVAKNSPLNTIQSPEVQKQTVSALKNADKKSWDAAKNGIAQTKDPLAAKLFFWLSYLRQDMGDINFIRLTQFIRQNPDWPQIYQLRLRAEKYMPNDLTPRDVVAWFDDYPPVTADGTDRYLSAILATGNVQKARDFLADWWANTALSRNHQKNLFRKYNRYINTAAHHKRLDMLLLKGQEENALAIADVLKQGYPELARARIGLSKQRSNVNALVDAVPKNLRNDAGLLYERLRWRRKNSTNEGAIEILNVMHQLKDIQNPSDWWLERHIITRRLIEEKNYGLAYKLSAAHGQDSGLSFAQGEWLAGWLALRFLKEPQKAFTHFQTLHGKVSSPISKSRGAYWAGRAADAAGYKDIAKQWYNSAAKFRTAYYGQLAAAELEIAGDIQSNAPPQISFDEEAAFNRNELIQAARLFHMAGMRDTASGFIHAFVKSENSAKGYRFAAELASELNRYYDAVRIAKKATQDGMFLTAQAYPVITEQLRGINTEWSLIHALIRQESVFDFDARSHAGALGLMQLMPATARETAKKLGIAHSTSWLTTKPDHNIKLGSTYLQRMLDRYDGAYPLAIAAYNAGPGRVDKWVKIFGDPRKGEIDIIDWMELIPIYETRNYVQRVVEGTYVYRLRLKNAQGNDYPKTGLAMPRNLRQL